MCRRCTNYIFIFDLTHGFNGLDKDHSKTRRETFKFGDLVRLKLEILRYIFPVKTHKTSRKYVFFIFPQDWAPAMETPTAQIVYFLSLTVAWVLTNALILTVAETDAGVQQLQTMMRMGNGATVVSVPGNHDSRSLAVTVNHVSWYIVWRVTVGFIFTSRDKEIDISLWLMKLSNCCTARVHFLWLLTTKRWRTPRSVSNHTSSSCTPFAKSNGRFFQTRKSTWCPHPICTIFGRFMECMSVVISSEKYIDFWH